MAAAAEERERERRGGALPPVLVRPAAVSHGFGAGGAEAGLGRLFWGANGRGGFLGGARAVFGPAFTPAQLTLLSGGLGASVLLGLVVAFAQLGAASNDGATAVVWAVPAPEDGAGAALGRSAEGPRPTPEDLLAGQGVLTEPPSRESDAPKSEPAAPPADVPVPDPASEPAPEGPVDEAVPPADAPRLYAGEFGFRNAAVSSGGGLRDALSAGVPPAAAREAAFRPVAGDSGTLPAPARALARARLSPLGGRQARASRAAGQLRFAQRASTLGLGATGADAARQYSTDAFEQKSAIAGPPTGGVGLTGGEFSGPLGVGAPDVTQAPAVGPVENQTPYQDKADDAKKGIDMAVLLMALGAGLMAGGLAMLLMGKQMLAAPDPTGATKAQGSMLMKIGAMMLMAGLAALAAGAMMAQDAKQKGKDIGQESGQREQGRVVETCADDALAGDRCRPKPIAIPRSTVQEDVASERQALTGRPLR
jgi:hypothetical protein